MIAIKKKFARFQPFLLLSLQSPLSHSSLSIAISPFPFQFLFNLVFSSQIIKNYSWVFRLKKEFWRFYRENRKSSFFFPRGCLADYYLQRERVMDFFFLPFSIDLLVGDDRFNLYVFK
jgi:hypothetical protein